MKQGPSSVGVIVARFQIPELHAGHRYLLNFVRERHEEVCVVLGSTEAQLTKNNPLSAEVRRLMLQNSFPGVVVCDVSDQSSDEAWSAKLDALIESVFPGRRATLYGSRGSFIPHYRGRFPTHEVEHIHLESGTSARNAFGDQAMDSPEFRAGIIYAAYHRRPAVYPTVDIAILDPQQRTALLGRRKADGGKYRFIGGFVDPKDPSIRAAAIRETSEEAGPNLTLGEFALIDSIKIDDPRYRGTADVIMTTFFRTDRLFGYAEAGDDMEEVAWFPYEQVGENLIDIHAPLGGLFNQFVRDAS